MKARELFDIKDKVAIITGGSIGLGHQIAEGLAEAGANVVICARNIERCKLTATEIKEQLGVRTLALEVDVKDPKSVQAMVDKTKEEFGRIDILINNAGITWAAPADNFPLKDWQKVIDVNVTGVFLCSQAVGRVMIEQGGGKIVNFASVAGLGGAPSEAMDAIAYNTSKGAVITFTKDLAVKWAKYNINVNAIAPGWFPTHMSKDLLEMKKDLLLQSLPMKRWGREDELKGAALFLSSPASNYVTGHILTVDGGQSAKI